jgi:hypothetical protein
MRPSLLVSFITEEDKIHHTSFKLHYEELRFSIKLTLLETEAYCSYVYKISSNII